MKLLHFSDLHIGMENYGKLNPETGLSSRLVDFFNTFDFIVNLAIKESVDAVVFAGDAYKTRDPNPTQQRGFGERIKKLAKAGIPTILVVGNHDTPNADGKANTLDIYSALEIDNVWVSRSPEYLKIPTKSGELQVITLPWLHKNDYKTVAEKILLLYGKIQKDFPTIFLSHAEIEGAAYGSEKGLAIANDVTIPLPLLQDKRIQYVALGHIHKHQVLSKPKDLPLIVYAGSPQRIDFGEEKEEKGVCLVTLDQKSASFEFIPTNARKFKTVEVNLKPADLDPTQTILEAINKSDTKEAIVRIIINIPADLSAEIQMDQIKKALKEAHYIAGISRNVERKERLKIEGADEVERLTPVEALQKYFIAKNFSKEKIKEIEKYAAQILES